MTDAYRSWNTRFLEYCLENSVDNQGNVFLTIDAFLEAQDEPDAEDNFKRIVREAFHPTFGYSYENRVASFCKEDAQRKPLCAALVGVTVLAAGEMDSNAYYEHLAHWLGCSERNAQIAFANPHAVPNPPIEMAWECLGEYFGERGLKLSLPLSNRGKRYVKLPQQHALLRQIDIRRLAGFFFDYQLSPRYRYSESVLLHRFSSWMRQEPLTQCGKNAWNDSVRREQVLNQVQEALDCWDEETYRTWRKVRDRESNSSYVRGGGQGHTTSSDDARRFDRIHPLPVRLFLESGDNGETSLYFRITNTNANSPDQVAFCDGAFKRRVGGHYSAICLDEPTTASILKEGCEQRIGGARICFQVEYGDQSNATVFLFQNPDADVFTQAESLRLGVPTAILVEHRFAGRVEEWLTQSVCRQRPKKLSLHPCLDADWVLFADFTPRFAVPAPPGLPTLHIDTDLSIRLTGGLRLDSNRRVWMESAPPSACFIGMSLPEEAMIDGSRFSVSPSGILASDAIPTSPGVYQITAIAEKSRPIGLPICIEAAHIFDKRNIEVLCTLFGDFSAPFVEAMIESEPKPDTPMPDLKPESTIGGAVYRWHILGASPGQYDYCAEPMTPEEVNQYKSAAFTPIWAIGRSARDLILISLTETPPRPQDHVFTRSPSPVTERLWLEAIQKASPAGLSPSLQTAWRHYQIYARSWRSKTYVPSGHAVK